MAKNKTVWVCSECGNEYTKWLGKCMACNTWDSLYEQKEIKKVESKNRFSSTIETEVIKLSDAKQSTYSRVTSGISEVDRVLGGGFAKGSLTLIGGEPRYSENQHLYFSFVIR